MIPAIHLPAEAFANLFHACNHGNPDEPDLHAETPQALLQRWQTELDDLHDPNLEFAALSDGLPVGVVHFRLAHTPSRTLGFINFIGIHPEHRGSGLGNTLHRLAISYLRSLGCTHYIGSTPDSNQSMRALFHRNGVPEVGRQVFLRG